MARWLPVLALRGGAGTTTWFASTGGFLLALTCVLAVAAVVTASCAAHFHRKDNKRNHGSKGFKSAHKFSSRALINSSKKLLTSMKWRRNENEEAYDRAVMEEEEEGGEDYLWQKSILMGERCEPPDFPGLIIYDEKGNQLPHFPPRSPNLNTFHPSLH